MNKQEKIKNIVIYFLTRAREDKFQVGIIRITKLLYLLDVEYFRDHGETYTGLHWIYYKYGPYSPELENIILDSGIILEEEPISSEKSIKKLFLEAPEEPDIDTMLENYLNRLWSKWGIESLPALLDFVYFETEPMLYVSRKGESLDFSTIKKYEGIKKIKWTDEQLKKLKEIGKSIKEKLDKMPLPAQPVYPPETSEMLAIWDEEEMSGVNFLKNFKGRVNLDPSIIKE